MRNRTSFILAAAFSLFFHLSLFLTSPYIRFKGLEGLEKDAHQLFRLSTVDRDMPQLDLVQKKKHTPGDIEKTVSFRDEMIHKEIAEKFSPSFSEDIFFEEEGFYHDEDVTIMQADLDVLKKMLEPQKETPERSFPPDISEPVPFSRTDVISPYSGKTFMPRKHSAEELGSVDLGFKQVSAKKIPLGEFIGQQASLVEVADISEIMDFTLLKYFESDTGKLFFEITMELKSPESLSPLQKEVVFLVDTSRSITERRLDEVSLAIANAIDTLKHSDFFNVIAFKGGPLNFRSRSVPADDSKRSEAIRFVRKMESSGRTNMERALLKLVTSEPASEASYVIFITDGRPTAGTQEIYKLLQLISERNVYDRAIYSMGVGLRVERELLDFISLQNRGEVVIPEDYIFFNYSLSELLRKIRYPVLTGIEYSAAGLDKKELFPRELNDLFRDGKLRLYGKSDENIERIVLEVHGQSAVSPKKFTFVEELEFSEEGDQRIAKEWAVQKSYDLLSYIVSQESADPVLIEELHNIVDEYGINVPYGAHNLLEGE